MNSHRILLPWILLFLVFIQFFCSTSDFRNILVRSNVRTPWNSKQIFFNEPEKQISLLSPNPIELFFYHRIELERIRTLKSEFGATTGGNCPCTLFSSILLVWLTFLLWPNVICAFIVFVQIIDGKRNGSAIHTFANIKFRILTTPLKNGILHIIHLSNALSVQKTNAYKNRVPFAIASSCLLT